MSKDRSYTLNFSLTASMTISDAVVQAFIRNANKVLAKNPSDKRIRAQQHFIKGILGEGVEASEANFDVLFNASIKKGYREACRNGELDAFEGVTRVQVKAEVIPKGTTLSTFGTQESAE